MFAIPSNQHNFVKVPSIDRDKYLLDIPEEWNIRYNPLIRYYPEEQVGAGLFDWLKKLKPIARPFVKPAIPAIISKIPRPVKRIINKGLQVIESTPGRRLRDIVINQLPKSAKILGKRLNIRDIARNISNVFLPKLVQRMKGSGMRPKMPMTKLKKQVYTAVLNRLRKRKRGGAIGAILSTLASAIPTAIEIGKTVWPHIKKAFQWLGRKIFPKLFKKTQQQGSGDSKAIKYLAEDIAKFLHRRAIGKCDQSGRGLGDLFKKFIEFVKNLFQRGKSIVQKVAPMIKKGWQAIPSDIRGKILPTVQQAIERSLKIKVPLDQIPKMMQDPRIKKIVSATIGNM